MIKAFGKTYDSVDEARAAWFSIEEVNKAYGKSDDRVTEQNAIADAILLAESDDPVETAALIAEADGQPAPQVEAQADVWTVEKQEYEMLCDHPQCVILHQHLNNASYDRPTEVEYTDRFGNNKWVFGVRRYHMATRREWVILLNGKREGEAGMFETYDTKREALAALRQRGLL